MKRLLPVVVDKADEHPLASAALSQVMNFLNERGSSLAGPSLEAIQALLKTLEDGLNGILPDDFHLASIDPGIGKTLSVSFFLKVWKEAGFLPQSSVLVAVSRLDEIQTYISQSGLSRADFAVYTKRDEFNALGSHAPALSPVLFTTQQMIQKRVRSVKAFEDLSEFHFEREPRTLRVWDESMVPEEALSVRVDDLGLLASSLRYKHPAFIQSVQQIQKAILAASVEDEVTVPDKLEAPDLRTLPAGKIADVVDALKQLSGQTLQIAEGSPDDHWLIGGKLALPDDFRPAVILDASGRVRKTYSLWQEHRGTLKRLPYATNDYSQLEIHLWQRGSGKATLSKAGEQDKIAEVLAKLINGQEAADWLVIHYKKLTALAGRLTEKLDGSRKDRVGFLTWGQHHGINTFKDVTNVIVIGQLWYRPMDYKALASSASGLPPSEFAEDDLEDVKWGEFQHHLLQALCRASVRKSVNGVAGACRAYVIATPAPQTEQRVRETFPGCRLMTWHAIEADVSERVMAAMEFLRVRIDAGDTWVGKKEVRDSIGTSDTNFSREILKVPAFQRFLAENDLIVERVGFSVMPAASFAPYDDEDAKEMEVDQAE